MPITFDIIYFPPLEIINIMNEFIKLKIIYWDVDFVKNSIDVNINKIESTRELKVISNDIYSSEPVIEEFKIIYHFFAKYNISIFGDIKQSISSYNKKEIIKYNLITTQVDTFLEYNKELLSVLYKNTISAKYNL